MIKQYIKSKKGITMTSLVVSIIILAILAGTTIYNMNSSTEVPKFNNMIADIELLEDKISIYYNKYGEIPKTDREIIINGIKYYEIDLAKMENITLRYGKEYGESAKLEKKISDVYVINDYLEVYYLKGIEFDGERYFDVLNKNQSIHYSKPEIKMISGEKNSEEVYITETSIEIVPGKDDFLGDSKTICIGRFTDKDGNTEQILNENITENKSIKLYKSGTYVFVVTTTDKNGSTTSVEKTIKINIQEVGFKLSDVITSDNYGDIIEYEANGVKDWKIFLNDGNNVFIITSSYLTSTSIPKNSKLISSETYKIYWEPIYGAPAPGVEYGHAPVVTNITENSKILERAQKFKCNWIQENIDKEWNSAKAIKDLLNDDVWNVFGEGVEGAEAIGSPTLELLAESWEQKGYRKIEYNYNEQGCFIGDNGVWFSLEFENGYRDPLYFPESIVKEDGTILCASYWLATVAIDSNQSGILCLETRNGGMFPDWYSAIYNGLRPVVCLPANTMATLEDGRWTNLRVD